MTTLLQEVERIEPMIIEIRRIIHTNPELAYHEFETAKLVASKLRELGIETRTEVGGTGVVGILRGAMPGKVVALRADMDALPITEKSNVPFKSRNTGVMHACGHDAHVAMLLGAATILARKKKELGGTVKFLFQPAEEDGGKGGAKPMIEDGAMDDPKVNYVFGLHIMEDQESGTFGTKPGPIMATPDSFEIRISGNERDGSKYETVNPIFISAQLVIALHGISSRQVNPAEPFVLSVCSMHSGKAANDSPKDAVIQGTIRTLNAKTRALAKKSVQRITKSVCSAFGARFQLKFVEDAYPVTYNDEKVTKRVKEILGAIGGTRVKEVPAELGGEDFSRFLQMAPGTFYFLGTHNKRKGCVYPNHSSRFKVDEDVLKHGSLSLALLALNFTKSGASTGLRQNAA